MENITFHHTLPIQLRFSDFDSFGHVNNTVYLSYYDLGKSVYFTELFPDWNMKDSALVVVHIDVDFMSQVLPNENVAVQTAIVEVGTKSLSLVQQLICVDSGAVKCVGRTVMVHYDRKAGISQPIPQEWVDAISRFEGRDVRKE